MNEWTIDLEETYEDAVKELEESFFQGPILDDIGRRLLTEKTIARIDGLKIEVFANEHPPPHFRVNYQGESNNFKISDCEPLHGNSLKKYHRNIKQWHKKNKQHLIKAWNNFRPDDCPVGKYTE